MEHEAFRFLERTDYSKLAIARIKRGGKTKTSSTKPAYTAKNKHEDRRFCLLHRNGFERPPDMLSILNETVDVFEGSPEFLRDLRDVILWVRFTQMISFFVASIQGLLLPHVNVSKGLLSPKFQARLQGIETLAFVMIAIAAVLTPVSVVLRIAYIIGVYLDLFHCEYKARGDHDPWIYWCKVNTKAERVGMWVRGAMYSIQGIANTLFWHANLGLLLTGWN